METDQFMLINESHGNNLFPASCLLQSVYSSERISVSLNVTVPFKENYKKN